MSPAARRHHSRMLFISAAVVLLSFALEVRPDQRVALHGLAEYPLPHLCSSRAFWGFECPGCGLTRSFIHLAHGRWQAASDVHPLGWLVAAAVLAQFPYRLMALRHRSGRPLGQILPRTFGLALVCLLLAVWVAARIPGRF